MKALLLLLSLLSSFSSISQTFPNQTIIIGYNTSNLNQSLPTYVDNSTTIIIEFHQERSNTNDGNQVISLLLLPSITLISTLAGYWFNNFLGTRKERAKLEIEIRRDVKDFLVEMYGKLSIVTDLIIAHGHSISKGKTRIIDEKGFPEVTSEEIMEKFSKRYLDFAEFIYINREKGMEIYFPKDFAESMVEFYAYIDMLYRKKSFSSQNYEKFQSIALTVTNRLEELLGLSTKKYL